VNGFRTDQIAANTYCGRACPEADFLCGVPHQISETRIID
jgi:hypothetical protein